MLEISKKLKASFWSLNSNMKLLNKNVYEKKITWNCCNRLNLTISVEEDSYPVNIDDGCCSGDLLSLLLLLLLLLLELKLWVEQVVEWADSFVGMVTRMIIQLNEVIHLVYDF